MRKKLLSLIALISLMGFCATAAFAVYIPPAGEPLFIKFDNKEQIFVNDFLSPYGELNWGIMELQSIALGNIEPPNPPYSYPSVGNIIWGNDGTQGEITGMFYNLLPSTDVTGALNATGGTVILFWNENPIAELSGATVADRTALDAFTNFTDGVFLAAIDFYTGAILDGALNTSVTGTIVPTSGNFTGIANSFGEVIPDYTYGGELGIWAELLDGNYFPVENNLANADIKFRNIYENTGVHDWDGPGVFGADSTDPARVYTVVPEPSTVILLGAGLLGLVGLSYRRRNK